MVLWVDFNGGIAQIREPPVLVLEALFDPTFRFLEFRTYLVKRWTHQIVPGFHSGFRAGHSDLAVRVAV